MIPGPAFAPAAPRRHLLAGLHPGMRLLAVVLGIASAYALPAAGAAALAGLAATLLAAAGLGPARQARALAPWWPVAVLVIVVHSLTTVAAAPLGHPSWAGLAAGAAALIRVAAAAGALALLVRTTTLDDLVAGLRWWTAPLRRLGVADDDLGLVLAVALGTAPLLLGEARRVEAVTALRRHGPAGGVRRGPLARARDRAAVLVPLLEALGRRAEALTLSLRRRRPTGAAPGHPPLGQAAALGLWTVALALLVAGGSAGKGW